MRLVNWACAIPECMGADGARASTGGSSTSVQRRGGREGVDGEIAVWIGAGDPPGVGGAPPPARGDMAVHVAGSRRPPRVDHISPAATPPPRRRAPSPPSRPHLAAAPPPRRGPSVWALRAHIATFFPPRRCTAASPARTRPAAAPPPCRRAPALPPRPRPSLRGRRRRSWCLNLLFPCTNKMKRHGSGFNKLRCGGPGMPVPCGV